LLIDTGHGGPAGARDALRILAAAKDAAIAQIDHLVLSHYHADHFGGLTELAAHMPIRHFIDHGTNSEPTSGADRFLPACATFRPA
jgi:glyoxylase-like metal-dependent hydrolase (beta-lactamase superfamily II)